MAGATRLFLLRRFREASLNNSASVKALNNYASVKVLVTFAYLAVAGAQINKFFPKV